MTNTPDIWMLHTTNPREGESQWSGCYIVEADAHNDAATMRKVTGLDWEVVPMVRADSIGKCLHQIAEPQADEVLDEREGFVNWLHGTYPLSYTIIQAADIWFHRHVAALAWKARAAISAAQHQQELAAYRFTVENREARIAELESQLDAIGAGGVEPLRKPAAPQAVQAAVPDAWAAVHFGGKRNGKIYNTCDTEKECNDYIAMVHQQSDSTTLTAKPVFFAAAPAHPAEGAPDERAAFEAWLGIKPCGAAHDFGWAAWQARAALAATQPAAQGVKLANCKGGKWLTVVYRDIQHGDEARTIGEHPKVSALSWSHALHDRDAAIAAQAKQGEQAS